jgi:hypothetical protein
VPVGLLLLLFASNLYLGIIAYPNPGFFNYIIFSAVYIILGIILISKIKFAELIGTVIPFAIFFIYPVLLDFENLNPWSAGILSAFNAIVIISCFIMVLLKIKTN